MIPCFFGDTPRKKIFWGWYVVFGSFAIMMINYGVRYSFGVFVKPMRVEYDWPMAVIQFGATVNLVTYACTGILTGRLLDRIRPRWVMIAGVLCTSLGLILASSIRTPLGLYLTYGVLVGAGTAGCGMVVTSVAIGKWFIRSRGLAIGIASMGIGLGTTLMAPLAGYIVKDYGWRNGFLLIGTMMLAVGLFIAYVFMGKSGPAQLGLLPDGQKTGDAQHQPAPAAPPAAKIPLGPILRSLQFWILTACNVWALLAVMMTFNLQIAYAIHKGIGELQAAAALGLIGLTGSCGKLFFGWFSDRVRDAKYAAAAGFCIMAIGTFLLYRAESVSRLYAFALVYGFGYGSIAPVMPYMISERFGSQALGTTYGLLVFFSMGLGGSIGPILGGYLYDTTGAYDLGWWICILVLLAVAITILTLKSKGPASGQPPAS